MSKTTIRYKDIAPGADEDAAVSSASQLDGSNLAVLPFGMEEAAPALSCEHGRWGLTGSYRCVQNTAIAFWSAALSGDDCAFADPPSITVAFDRQYSSVGISLTFDSAGGAFCTGVNIKWYQGDALKSEGDFLPDAVDYFCENRVEAYDKVVVTLTKTALPRQRARVEKIVFGLLRYFTMAELRGVSITNEMDLLALSLPTSKMFWTIDSKTDVDFMFQLKQPVEAVNGGAALGVYYIDAFSRSAPSIYAVECHDAFGVLDESNFSGGVYASKSAKSLLEEIVDGAFPIEYGIEDVNLTGALLAQTKREAIQQVLFAWGAVAATDGGDMIRVFALPDAGTAIGRDRTYVGVSTETASIVTAVHVHAHAYTANAGGSVEINGTRYSDTVTVYTVRNPGVTANTKENVKTIKNATLVSPAIGQAAARRVYDHYQRRNTHKSRFVWAGERLGDKATQPNAWGGTETGHIAKMEIRLSNTVAVDSETAGAPT